MRMYEDWTDDCARFHHGDRARGLCPDADLVRSGKAHQCTLSKLKAQLADKPQDPKIQEEIKSTTGLYETVIQSAGEGKKEALEKAIAAAVKDDGCP